MGKIRVLPEELANQIAAGEVVERPASVVKELLENSLDAGASRLVVEVEAGGRDLVRVQDDGCGMSREDAELAFAHHATSKIASADDLLRISTLGFRGEALPSIASVSRLTLRTVDGAASGQERVGVQVEIHGGRSCQVREIAWAAGTEVVARDLFYNVPARRKFLKAVSTELNHVGRLVTHYALAFPEKSFGLFHQGLEVFAVSPVSSLPERVYQLFGGEYVQNLVEVRREFGRLRLSGYASLPHEQRTNTYSQFFFVNRRMVRDKVITHAVSSAYKAVLPSGIYPVALLFLEVPPEEVDVNVHPSKIEIRFRDQRMIHDLIRSALEEAMIQGRKPIPKFVPSWRGAPSAEEEAEPGPEPPSPLAESVQTGLHSDFNQVPGWPAVELPRSSGPAPLASWAGASAHRPRPGRTCGVETLQAEFLPSDTWDSNLRPLGQFRESFIVATDHLGLLIVDQHVAHERILYERALDGMQQSRVPAQRLLLPLTFDLPPSQRVLLERILPELDTNGFEVELFGGSTVAVRAVPAVASECDARLLVNEILEGLEREQRDMDLATVRERVATSVACHAAIKVNMPLTREKMQWLLDELMRCRVHTLCPHGRPIILRYEFRDILRNFRRI
ncbi:MAG: DNA mismatch repair endonuclease MutL [Acidobacteria bacterium]|nr:DNA mismatch repair endonuclease MutL [Acidobacteriota bacterium]